ncbi:hypothetical protein D3OALGA1CA_3259 [Olavius algarvensis associated proteobacterium Delta 3]|nr:hypothetical protein D3OALGB2SA_1844 [Olavius algarvensis associated proteobacterium Delta 3]CAB5131505.1 hypothetical protein D3OALGA1CA_3259 [Olavius algarvensis associated proteobacterium Delta 3]
MRSDTLFASASLPGRSLVRSLVAEAKDRCVSAFVDHV